VGRARRHRHRRRPRRSQQSAGNESAKRRRGGRRKPHLFRADEQRECKIRIYHFTAFFPILQTHHLTQITLNCNLNGQKDDFEFSAGEAFPRQSHLCLFWKEWIQDKRNERQINRTLVGKIKGAEIAKGELSNP